jgi:hypothetical protein
LHGYTYSDIVCAVTRGKSAAGPAPTEEKPLEFLGYVAKFETAVYVLHAFQKKSQQTAKMDIGLARARYKLIGEKL